MRFHLSCKKMQTISDCNWNETHKHMVCKVTPNYLAKLVSFAKCLSVLLLTNCWFGSRCSQINLNIASALIKDFLERSGNYRVTECGFTLKHLSDTL